MTLSELASIVGIMISGASLAWALLSYYFKQSNKFEQDKLKARKTIKDLEGKLQAVFLDNMEKKIQHLEKQLQDHADKFDNMYSNYEGVSKRVERTSLMLDAVSEDVKRLYREVTESKLKNFGNVRVIDRKDD